MWALLQRQKEKHKSANAVGTSLLERRQRQEQQNQAAAVRRQWSKTYGKLRDVEKALFYDLKQLLTSQNLAGFGCGVTLLEAETQTKEILYQRVSPDPLNPLAIREKKGKPTVQSTACNTIQDCIAAACPVGTCPTRMTEFALAVDKVAQCRMSQDRTASQTSWSTYSLGSSARLVYGLSSIIHMLERWSHAASDSSAYLTDTKSACPARLTHTEDIPSFKLLGKSWLNHAFQMAVCIFQSVASTLEEEVAALEQACAVATTEVSAALATLRKESFFRQLDAPRQMRSYCEPNSLGDTRSLTDTEDAILSGEAPQVQLAAQAASELTNVLGHKAASTAEKQQETIEQPPSPRVVPLIEHEGLTTLGRATKNPEDFISAQAPQNSKSSMHPSWESVLREYTEKLLGLEEQHTKELEHYQHQVRVHKSLLNQAVAGLISKPVIAQQAIVLASDESTRLKCSVGRGDELSAELPPAGQTVLTLQKEVLPAATGVGTETGIQCISLPSAEGSLTPNEQIQTSPKSFVDRQAGQRGISEEDRTAVAAALVTVRWLVMTTLSKSDGVEEQTEPLLQRLQLAFPSAGLNAIRAVIEAQRQLTLLQQRRLTSRGVWTRKRRSALSDVLNNLEKMARKNRELAESYRASLMLQKRRNRLSEKLRLQRKLREQQNRNLGAAEKEEREAEEGRKRKKAKQEKLRREKEKLLLADFRQRKLLRLQEQEKAAQEEYATKEPSYVKLVRAARVSRRQEQYNLRVLEQHLERQERQLREELLRGRLVLAADKLKPSMERNPLRLHQQTVASQSYKDAAAKQRQQHQEQLKHRLWNFGVEHCYSCAALMQDIRFRLSTALAESQLLNSKAAQELLLSMCHPVENCAKGIS